MREYAERLAKAAPERFKLHSNRLRDATKMPSGAHWTDFSTYETDIRIDTAHIGLWWAFWGPLTDEVYLGRLIDTTCPTCQGMGWVDKPHCESEQLICPRCSCENNCQIPLLEAIADAVCRSFEAEGKP